MENYLFDLQAYLQMMKIFGENDDFVAQYEKLVQPFEDVVNFSDFPFWEPFLAKLETVPYQLPEEFADRFDWELLFRLMTGSPANVIDFEWQPENPLPEIMISVTTTGEDGIPVNRVNKVSELYSFQVLRLFEIYTKEIMRYELLSREDQLEDNGLSAQNERMLRRNKELVFRIQKAKLINGLLQ